MGAQTAKQLTEKTKGHRLEQEKVETQPTEEVNMNGTNDMETGGDVTVVETFRLNWWLVALRGLVAVLFGVLALVWPGVTLIALVWLFGAFALVNGILSLVLAAKAPKGYPRIGSLILGGLLGILAGLLTFVMPGITALGLLILIALWAIVTGIMELVTAIRLRKIIANEWLLVLTGVLSVAFGVLLILMPGAGALALIWWIGIWALVFGILLMVLAFRMRHWKGFVAVGRATI
jgi:uncharacterized membrane protein HdeD (DUF308 family)